MVKVYDFDKTLTYNDTSMMFLFYCCNLLKMKNLRKSLIFLFAVLHKLTFITNTRFKELAFGLVFNGKNKYEINDISRSFFEINDNIFNKLGNFISSDKAKHQYVVTASPECYVRRYFKDLTVIGTLFSFDLNDIYYGIKRNCYGVEKVRAINEYGILEIDEFYTDSLSDKPMMDISKRIFLVERDHIREM